MCIWQYDSVVGKFVRVSGMVVIIGRSCDEEDGCELPSRQSCGMDDDLLLLLIVFLEPTSYLASDIVHTTSWDRACD